MPERPVLFWIAEACKRIRKDTHHRASAIAGLAGVDQSTVWRFENHVTRSPRLLHEMLDAYVRVTGVPAVRVLERAAELAHEDDPGGSAADD